MNKILKHILFTIVFVALSVISKAQDSTKAYPTDVPDSSAALNTSQNNFHFKEQSGIHQIATRTIPAKELNTVKSNEAYWYINEAPPRSKKEAEKPSDLRWLNTIVWVVIAGIILTLLVWFLRTSHIQLFRNSGKKISEKKEQQLAENIFEMDFDKEIQKTTDEQNYRLAVRLLYLKTLRDLSQRNFITYTHEKTNSDYLLQLAGTSLYKSFFRLTRSFDYTWYGQFELSQNSFLIIQHHFNSFQQQLSR